MQFLADIVDESFSSFFKDRNDVLLLHSEYIVLAFWILNLKFNELYSVSTEPVVELIIKHLLFISTKIDGTQWTQGFQRKKY